MGVILVMYLGGELAYDIFVIGGVFIFRGIVSKDLCIFFFSSFLDAVFILCDSKPCTYDVIYI